MDINNYTQEETAKIVNNMYSAGRRTSNVIVRNAVNAGCARLREMESVIFQLRDKVRELETDNAALAETNERLLKQKGAREDAFDYSKLENDFWASGDEFRKIRLEKHGKEWALWYKPKINKVRMAIERSGLPIDVQQRTSTKDPSVTPIMILFRTDDSEGADE